MKTILYIAFGGAIGSVLRYIISLLLKPSAVVEFPVHTIVINLAGCFGIGLVWALAQKNTLSDAYLGLLMIGLLGGFTTFSTFGLETFHLIREKAFLTATGYVLASNIFGLLLVFAGYLLIQGNH